MVEIKIGNITETVPPPLLILLHHMTYTYTTHIYLIATLITYIRTYIHTYIHILILILIYVHPHADIPHIQYHSITTTHPLADPIIPICLQ